MGTERLARRIYLWSLLLATGWLLLLIAPAWLMAHGDHDWAIFLYQSFSVACHQMPERTFHFHGFPLAVCSRCTGIYAGGLAGLMIYPLTRRLAERRTPASGWLLAALIPMLIDVGGNAVGLFNNTFFTRAMTGGLTGLAAAFYLFPSLISAFDDWRRAADSPGKTGGRWEHLPRIKNGYDE